MIRPNSVTRIGNINWANLSYSNRNLLVRRVISIILLIIAMVIMAVPSVGVVYQAFIYNLQANVPYAKYFMDLEFIQDNANPLSNLVMRYVPGLWSAVANMLVFYVIDLLAALRKYPDYTSYQHFVNSVSIFYLFVNVLLLPLISISANSDIVQVARKFFTWDRFNQTFLYTNSGTLGSPRHLLLDHLATVLFYSILCRACKSH